MVMVIESRKGGYSMADEQDGSDPKLPSLPGNYLIFMAELTRAGIITEDEFSVELDIPAPKTEHEILTGHPSKKI